jgi:hypothetical protein
MDDLNDGAAHMFRMYEAYIVAGFTPPEALELVKAMLVETIRAAAQGGQK